MTRSIPTLPRRVRGRRSAVLAAALVGALTAGCGRQPVAPAPAAEPAAAFAAPSVDLVRRSEEVERIGAWSPPEGVVIEPVRIDQLSRRCLVVPPGGRVELPPAVIEPGTQLRFDYGLAVGRREESDGLRIRLSSASVPGASGPTDGAEGADAAGEPRLLHEVELSGRLREWGYASLELPADLGESLVLLVEVVGDDEDPARAAIGDLLLLPPVVPGAERVHPNVLLVSLDTLRADHLPVYGYEDDTAPFLSRLAEEMTVYDRAYSPSTWTLPSHASVFTGLYPSQHGAISVQGELAGHPLPEDAVTLAELLRDRGYLTMGIVSGPMLKRNYAVNQGFATWSDDLRPAEDVRELALEWVARAEGRPFFLFLNFFDVHLPLDPPGYDDSDLALYEPLGIDITRFQWSKMKGLGLDGLPDDVARAMLARYDAEIRYLDSELERLFDALEGRGVLDQAIVCLFGDHGESYGEHERWGHGGPFHDPQSHVPFFYRDRRAPRSEPRIARATSTVEIPSTILSDLGLAAEGAGFERVRRPVYGERFSPRGSNRMLLDGRYKYVVNLGTGRDGRFRRAEQLFDLERDPEEHRDLATLDPDALERMRERFAGFLDAYGVAPEDGAAAEETGERAELSREELELKEELRALGYVD